MLVRVQAIAKGIPGCTPCFDSCDTIISNGLDMSVICIYLILIYKRQCTVRFKLVSLLEIINILLIVV